MLTYNLDERDDKPIYEFLYESIREDIRTGVIKPREKLPSKRHLAEHLSISVITVKNAYEQLLAEGYITSREREGYFAADLGSAEIRYGLSATRIRESGRANGKKENDTQRGRGDELCKLSSGAPDPALFPFSVWSRLMRRVLSDQDKKLLERVPGIGVLQLREAIAEHLLRFRGMAVDPNRIVVGAGTEFLYNLIIQLLGRERIYALENPGYRKIASILDRCGIRYIPVGLDRWGMKPETGQADVIHLSPSHHFPTGIVMPAPRRRKLLNIASAADGYIIEDDYDSEFRFEGKPVPTMFSEDGSGRVIYINTFAETISPSLRISYMVLPEELMRKFTEEMSFYSCTVPSFEQYTLAAFITEGYFEKHVNRMRLHYRQRRDAVDALISEADPRISAIRPSAGMNFLLNVKTERGDAELKQLCRDRGFEFSFVSDYAYGECDGYSGMIVLNFCRVPSEKLSQAMRVLSDVL